MPKRRRGPGFWGTPVASISPVHELCCAPTPGAAVTAVAAVIIVAISRVARFPTGRRWYLRKGWARGGPPGLRCALRTARSRYLADRDARTPRLGASRRWEGQIERGLNTDSPAR